MIKLHLFKVNNEQFSAVITCKQYLKCSKGIFTLKIKLNPSFVAFFVFSRIALSCIFQNV